MHSMERTGHLPRLVANFNIIFGNLIRDFPLSAAFSLSVFFFFRLAASLMPRTVDVFIAVGMSCCCSHYNFHFIFIQQQLSPWIFIGSLASSWGFGCL